MIPRPGPRSAGPGIASPRSPEMAFRVRAGGGCGHRRARTANSRAPGAGGGADAEIRSLIPAYRFSTAPAVIWSRSGGDPTAAVQALPLKNTGFLAVVVLDRDHRGPIS